MPDTLHDQLTAALTGALTEMFRPEVGHSMTGDVCHLRDDARTLAQVAEAIIGQRVRELEAALSAVARVHSTRLLHPDSIEYCTECGQTHPCPTRKAVRSAQ
ncbi:hypothetical protein NGM33_28545 [Nocardiopsis dassonvillei]|uniref:hypothetical protein n=1 Tax=Nocardiopsis dassonvillei TaxID=2014 RepID=UPI0020A253AB|nr:hypothetical protein [Nocardiopsis dassonvillei]MCP3017286.1 hypothetical protein [Nocardiopsis dassonvillei]